MITVTDLFTLISIVGSNRRVVVFVQNCSELRRLHFVAGGAKYG